MIQNNKEQPVSKFICVFIGVSIFLRICLQMGLPVYGIGSSGADDMLMVNYADSILDREWLGSYNYFTLNKVPGFGIFLAICRLLNIPYMLALGMLYSLASLACFFALYELSKNEKLSAFLFVYVLYSPVMLDISTQRVYRMSIIPILTLFIVSSYLFVFLRRDNLKRCIPWLICAAFNYSLFCITREDVIWIKCFVFGATVLLIALVLKEQRKIIFKFAICLMIPVVLSAGTEITIKAINYEKYGIFETNDFKSTAFADMGKNILKVKGEDKQYVWVTHDTIKKIYEVSPTFATLEEFLEKEYIGGYQLHGALGDDGEIEKDYIMWAIRAAAYNAGVYKNAVKANEFFSKANQEIENGFKSDQLEENNAIILSNLARPFYWSDMPGYMDCFKDRIIEIVSYSKLKTTINSSIEMNNNLRFVEALTNGNVIYPNKSTYEMIGWIFSINDNEKIKIEILNSTGEYISAVNFIQSPEVYSTFAQNGEEYKNAQKSRFDIKIDYPLDDAIYKMYINDELRYEGKLVNIEDVAGEDIKLCVDYKGGNTSQDISKKYAERPVKISNIIIKVYQLTGFVVGIVAIIGFFVLITFNIYMVIRKKESDFDMMFVLVGLLLTMFANVMIVAMNYYEAHNVSTSYHYLAGVYPIWQLFVSLIIVLIYKTWIKRTRNYDSREDIVKD